MGASGGGVRVRLVVRLRIDVQHDLRCEQFADMEQWHGHLFHDGLHGKANTAGLVALSSTDSPYKAASYCGTLSAMKMPTGTRRP
jgi:hypothetical protein